MLTLKIKTPKKVTKIFTLFGIILTSLGIVLSFILDNDFDYRSFYIGTPLTAGIIILIILKVFFPIEDVGKIVLDDNSIEICKADNDLEFLYSDIKDIRLVINGYEMELKRSWWFLPREIFPYEYGHNNQITLETKDKIKSKALFFLNNESEEKELIALLSNASKDFNFNLKLN